MKAKKDKDKMMKYLNKPLTEKERKIVHKTYDEMRDKIQCSLLHSCNNQYWLCTELTELWRKYTCQNCGGTKTVFRNLYSGYQDGN